MKPGIILIGAGGHCRSCIDVIEQENRFTIVGIVDRQGADNVSDVLGYPIIGTDDYLPNLQQRVKNALITVGHLRNVDVRKRLFRLLELHNFNLPAIISPLSYVSKHAQIGRGTIVLHRVTVNAGARIGDNCILNSHCLIEHDAIIENNCHVSTGVLVNGHAILYEGSFVGSGTVIVQCVQIPENSFIKAHSLMTMRKSL